jgi:serine/threonine-protein kinase
MPGLVRNTTLPKVRRKDGRVEILPSDHPRYSQVRALGEGGMGEVLLVQDNDIDRKVAMKRLKDATDEGFLVRFLDEIKTVGRLEHPNIVPIYDAGVDEDGACYFIMKYVEGETLREVIRRLADGDPGYHQKYTFEVRARIFLSVLHAIRYAHSRGIIHRDLKPENIMISPMGEVQVMDWGVARALDGSLEVNARPSIWKGLAQRLAACKPEERANLAETLPERLSETSEGALVGSPAYMAPEQALDGAVDERTDLYALSVLFYELMALRHCFHDKKNLQAMLMATMYEDPIAAVHQRHPSQGCVPIEYSYFIKKGMKKKPEDRYQSAQEMIRELELVMDGCVSVQCPSTLLKRTNHGMERILDRRPVLMTAVFYACAALVLSLAALGAWDLVAR